MAKLIRLKDFDGKVNEPPLRAKRGITSETIGKPIKMTMNRVVIPPGAKNQCHYHVRCDAGMHILKGRLKMFFGPLHQQEEAIAEEGDFVFVPQGESMALPTCQTPSRRNWSLVTAVRAVLKRQRRSLWSPTRNNQWNAGIME